MSDLLKKYILMIPREENDIASHVLFRDGVANFWHQEDGYVLVINNDPKYWGNEELSDFNDIRLAADELYVKLTTLPEANVDNFYGMRGVIDDLLKEVGK